MTDRGGPSGNKPSSQARGGGAPGKTRDLAKQETRTALLEAGRAAFAEQGLDTPSLDAICARAGYTRGAFYVHFRGREDFIVAVMEHLVGALLDAVIATGDAAVDLERTVRLFVEAVQRGQFPPSGVPTHQVLAAAARSDHLRERQVELLTEAIRRVAYTAREGQHAGTVRADVDAEQLGSLLVAITLGVQQALELGLPFDAERAAETLLTLLMTRPD